MSGVCLEHVGFVFGKSSYITRSMQWRDMFLLPDDILNVCFLLTFLQGCVQVASCSAMFFGWDCIKSSCN